MYGSDLCFDLVRCCSRSFWDFSASSFSDSSSELTASTRAVNFIQKNILFSLSTKLPNIFTHDAWTQCWESKSTTQDRMSYKVSYTRKISPSREIVVKFEKNNISYMTIHWVHAALWTRPQIKTDRPRSGSSFDLTYLSSFEVSSTTTLTSGPADR